ncbi:DUF928 domain-containing protein [Thermoleptolyngbya sp. C42_A2020_037]|uniref:DUF928 domain-containing protein n=1 Tax=Thermoleptolyngbya sp. C42_A2020_037 TaxID=2747799 RepID=UPI0025E63A4C|nr:DUF928 domain-containing protein [Thermoleptolyngbya sp. C42_A2020_037]
MRIFLSPSTLLVALLGTGIVSESSTAEARVFQNAAPRSVLDSSALSRPAFDPPVQIAQLGFSVRQSRPVRNRIGGITRGGQACSLDGATVVRLLPLVPPTDPTAAEQGKINIEPTVSEQPMVFVYVPQTVARQAQFSVAIATDTPSGRTVEETLYEYRLPLPQQPSVIGIPLRPLDEGRLYRWVFQLQCDPTGDRSGDALTDGWLQRVAPNSSLSLRLNRATPQELPALYARSGLWQDTITSLGTLRAATPGDAALLADWASLLTSIRLDDLANVPLLFPPVEYRSLQE